MGTSPATPPGVDPQLWEEFRLVEERVNELYHARVASERGEGPKIPTKRVMIEIPEDWAVLFAWVNRRIKLWSRGEAGPTGYTPDMMDTFGLDRLTASVVRRHIHWVLDNEFHIEWHSLSGGGDDRLKQRKMPEPPQSSVDDLDDGIPF